MLSVFTGDISGELQVLEDAALAIEGGLYCKGAFDNIPAIHTIPGFLEALPLARAWKAKGIGGLQIDPRVLRAVRNQNVVASNSTGRMGFVRAITSAPDLSDFRLDAFWLEVRKSLTAWGLDSSATAGAIVGAFREMHDNVLQHSGKPFSGLCGFSFADCGSFEFGVSDSGVGLTTAYLSANPGEVTIDSSQLLEDAVLHGKSRLSDPGRGTGFGTLLRTLRRFDAGVRIRTDCISLNLTPLGGSEYSAELREQAHLPGFVVCAQLKPRPD